MVPLVLAHSHISSKQDRGSKATKHRPLQPAQPLHPRHQPAACNAQLTGGFWTLLLSFRWEDPDRGKATKPPQPPAQTTQTPNATSPSNSNKQQQPKKKLPHPLPPFNNFLVSGMTVPGVGNEPQDPLKGDQMGWFMGVIPFHAGRSKNRHEGHFEDATSTAHLMSLLRATCPRASSTCLLSAGNEEMTPINHPLRFTLRESLVSLPKPPPTPKPPNPTGLPCPASRAAGP